MLVTQDFESTIILSNEYDNSNENVYKLTDTTSYYYEKLNITNPKNQSEVIE